jgi:hypothetical protein
MFSAQRTSNWQTFITSAVRYFTASPQTTSSANVMAHSSPAENSGREAKTISGPPGIGCDRGNYPAVAGEINTPTSAIGRREHFKLNPLSPSRLPAPAE